MDRRRARIGRSGTADTARSRRASSASRRYAYCGLLVLLVAATQTGLQFVARPTAEAAAAEASEAANIMWRFDGSGRFPNIHPPIEWRPDHNILWKTPVMVGGYSSPIVVKDKVFVTAEMGSLVCLDLADGKILWQKDLFNKNSTDIPAELSKKLMRGCGGDSKQSTPTPASNGQLVFYINAMGLCACYDLQGNQRWIRIIETADDEEYFSASPNFVGNRIILSWGCLLALDATDGSTVWKAAEALPTHGTPAIAKIDGTEVAITPGGDIVRLADGEILCAGLFESTFTTPLVEGNVLYVIDSVAKALEVPSKAERGLQPKELWKTKLKGEYMASPIFRDGLLYTIEAQKCRLQILDAKTGEVLTHELVADAASPNGKIESGRKIDGLAQAKFAYASPVAAERNAYFFDDAGNTAVLELGREGKLAHVNRLKDSFVGTPFFVGDRIIIRGSETVYCIGEKR
jgi:outer membrane protein assembly factor BamB